MKYILTMVVALLAAGTLNACAGEGEGAGTFTLAMMVEGLDEMADSMDTDVTVNEAFLRLEAAELAAAAEGGGEEEDDGHDHASAKGEGHDHGDSAESVAAPGAVVVEPGLIDLVNDPDPMTGEVDLASDVFALTGEYTALTLSAGPGEIEGEEQELTFLLEGEIECVGGGDPETLLIELESDLDGLSTLAVDLDVENLASSELEIAFHADELLAGIDICEIATLAGVLNEGEIEISEHAAEEAEEMMEEELHEALHEAIELIEDALGDAFHVGEHEHG